MIGDRDGGWYSEIDWDIYKNDTVQKLFIGDGEDMLVLCRGDGEDCMGCIFIVHILREKDSVIEILIEYMRYVTFGYVYSICQDLG